MNITQEFILFPKDCLCEGVPNEDFMITRGHPIFYNDDYYVSENFLNDKIKIVRDTSPYMYHLMFDSHEVVFTNDLKTTSLPNITNYYNKDFSMRNFCSNLLVVRLLSQKYLFRWNSFQ